MSEETARVKKKKPAWKKPVLIVLLVLVVGAIVWFTVIPGLRAGATTTYDSYTASVGTISNSLSFSGSISVTNYETLTPSAEGTVRQIYVAEEQSVVEGDRLVRLSTGETLKANFDGQVNEIAVSVGDSVTVNTGLIQIVDFENMSVSIRVDEYAISSISVGQACRVTVTALDVTFDSTITHINRISSSNGGTAYYTVTAGFTATPNVLPGMQVTVVIPEEEAIDAVILNKNALSFGEDNSAYVLTKADDGTMTQVPVEIGVDNDNYVEITSGISAGDTVYAQAETTTDATGGLSSLFSMLGGGTEQQGATQQGGGSRDNSNRGGGNMPSNFGGGGGMPGGMP